MYLSINININEKNLKLLKKKIFIFHDEIWELNDN